MRTVRWALIGGMLLTLLSARRAHACSIPAPMPHEIVASSDGSAPEAPDVVVREVERGAEGGCGGSDSCHDIASVTLVVTAADDVSPPSAIGYTVVVLEGALPEGAHPPSAPVRAWPDGSLFIVWVETDPQPFWARLAVSAVDRAGNVSAPTTVEVSEGNFEGCRAVRVRSHSDDRASFMLVASAVAFVFVSRRRRTVAPRAPSRRGGR